MTERRVGKGRIVWGGELSPKPAAVPSRAAGVRLRAVDLAQGRKPRRLGPARHSATSAAS